MSKVYSKYIKRSADVVVSITVLSVASVPMLLVAILIKASSPGPAIFSQKRVGKDRKAFRIYKFRSMTKDTPSNLSAAKRKKAGSGVAKLTRVGRVLRVTSIDELPQFYNVLRGDMALIGPRPVIPQEKKLTDERERLGALKVKPGITGLAQVKGRNDIDYLQKAEYDAMYAKNVTLRRDFSIVVRSAVAIVTRTGNQDASRTNKRKNTYAQSQQEE